MKYLMIIATSILLPLGTFAGVRVNINAHVSNNPQYEYSDEGDPWFEDGEEKGPEKMSYEFQWSIYGGAHVLRYRQVHFHVSNDSWTFGPWMHQDGYCPNNCRLHHRHHFYQRKPVDRHWNREIVRGGRQGGPRYYYVYRPDYKGVRSNRKSYRYEYQRDKYEHGEDQRNDQGNDQRRGDDRQYLDEQYDDNHGNH
jgi:hypothetical protein